MLRRGSSGLNLLLGVDKPAGLSSHDVVNRVRRALGERRVGHAGTLDPAATGVLVVGVGQGTRLMGLLTADTKSYLARITFGEETNTDDAEGEVVRTAPAPSRACDEGFARDALQAMLGRHLQVPPAYSAISVGGKRAYALARAGEEVRLEARPIEVTAADLVSIETDGDQVSWQCAFTVSKGTYVRAMARDLGRELGSAAHLTNLCRTSSGLVRLASCVSLERLGELGAGGVREVALDPVRALGLPVRTLTDRELSYVEAGRALPLAHAGRPDGCGGRVALVRETRLVGVWEPKAGRLRPVANFPQGIEGVRS